MYGHAELESSFHFRGFELDYALRTLAFEGKIVQPPKNSYAMPRPFTVHLIWPDAARQGELRSLDV